MGQDVLTLVLIGGPTRQRGEIECLEGPEVGPRGRDGRPNLREFHDWILLVS